MLFRDLKNTILIGSKLFLKYNRIFGFSSVFETIDELMENFNVH